MRGSFEVALKLCPKMRAVEVGVYEGENASSMLRQGIDFLYLVDPYKAHVNHNIYTDLPTFAVTQEEMHQAKSLALSRLQPYAGHFILLEQTSEEAAQGFEDGSLDFVYIDTIHNYETAKKDASLWFPKVRPGGVLGGHDYVVFNDKRGLGYLGLVQAINEFAKEKSLELHSGGADWWVVKP